MLRSVGLSGELQGINKHLEEWSLYRGHSALHYIESQSYSGRDLESRADFFERISSVQCE